jgi:hypothetical protein
MTLNEEDHIADCIRSVGSFADEIAKTILVKSPGR